MTRYLAEFPQRRDLRASCSPSQSPDVRKMIDASRDGRRHDYVPDSQYEEIVKVHLPALAHDCTATTSLAAASPAIVFRQRCCPPRKSAEEDMEVECGGRRMPLDEAMARTSPPAALPDSPASCCQPD